MTQGKPISPTIFNVVMDAVIRHWVTVVTPTEAGTGGGGLTIIDLLAYLYTENILIASTQQDRLQRSFEFHTDFFNHVRLQVKAGKMVRMVCQTCHAPGGMSEESYERWTTRIGPKF